MAFFICFKKEKTIYKNKYLEWIIIRKNEIKEVYQGIR